MEGEILRTVARLSTRNRAAVLLPPEEGDGGRPFVLATQPFADDPLVHVDPTGRHVVLVERKVGAAGTVPSFTVARLTAEGDTLMRRTHRVVPVPVEPRWAESALRREAERVSDDPARGLDAAREGLFIPGRLAPVSDAKVGPDGWIWLKREAVPDARHATWEILSPEGDRLGRIGIPASWSVRAVVGAEAWALEPAPEGGAHLWHVRALVHGQGGRAGGGA